MPDSNISPRQKTSLVRWGLLFTFAAIAWPLIHQIAMERIHLTDGSMLAGLLKSSRMTMPGIIAMGMLYTLMRAIGFAEGSSEVKEQEEH